MVLTFSHSAVNSLEMELLEDVHSIGEAHARGEDVGWILRQGITTTGNRFPEQGARVDE